MTDDKWADTLAMIKEKFKVEDEGRRAIDGIPNAFVYFIVFESPQGKVKLERSTQPVVLDRKAVYSKLAGAASNIEYIYSDAEVFHKLQAFRFNESRNDWEELKSGMFS